MHDALEPVGDRDESQAGKRHKILNYYEILDLIFDCIDEKRVNCDLSSAVRAKPRFIRERQ